MQKRNETIFNIVIIIFFATSGVLRWISLSSINVDMSLFYVRFYDYFVEHGVSALGDNFSLGTPLYLYLVWLATFTRSFLSPPLALKLISISFDLISALAVYKIVRLKFAEGQIPYLASAIFLLMPTVLMNSTLWGQIDSLYASFLLWCIYFLLIDNPILVMAAFGLSISIKLQAAFLFPFLVIMMFKKRISWYHYFIPPLVYVLTIIPAVLVGRPFWDALTIYLSWTVEENSPALNAPNLYSLITLPPYYIDWTIATNIGFTVAFLSIVAWIYVYAKKQYDLNRGIIILSALVCSGLVPYVLPKMHDRYFYMADVLSLILAFYFPAYWFIPICYQIASGLAYTNFLFSVDPSQYLVRYSISAGFTTFALIFLLVKQHQETIQETKAPVDQKIYP